LCKFNSLKDITIKGMLYQDKLGIAFFLIYFNKMDISSEVSYIITIKRIV